MKKNVKHLTDNFKDIDQKLKWGCYKFKVTSLAYAVFLLDGIAIECYFLSVMNAVKNWGDMT